MSRQRINLPQTLPEAYRLLSSVEAGIRKSGLEASLIDLVKLRASQINSCAYCIDMHSKDARKGGETEQRLHLLSAWREAESFYTDRERAVLAWTEHLTRLSTDGAPDVAYDRLRGVLSEAEIANLTLLIGMINLWNRLGVGFHLTPAGAA
jgi:AhpD family alkylhydroperoxidase